MGSIAAACGFTLNQQGLLAGLMAMVPGLEGKPIEAVENACASGGQAVLSVAHKLLLGMGDVGLAVGYEKMRNDEGKMDGKAVGEALGYYSHPAEREGKTYVFPHLFAEVMQHYMETHGVSEEDLARIAVQEYANATHNPDAQMQKVDVSLEQAMTIEGINRYIVDGLPLKTFDCSQITDGWASMILATEEGLSKLGVAKADAVRLAGWGQATDPLAKGGRDVLRPRGALRAMGAAYEMAGLGPDDIDVAEVHDCFSVMGALGVEVLGKAEPGQLQGKAPAGLQVADPKVAATFNIGGPICASVCTVLTRAD